MAHSIKDNVIAFPKPKPDILPWLNDARGIYIPRDFAKSFADRGKSVQGVSAEDWEILDAGPDHYHYWDAWEDVLNNATVTDHVTGITYTLHQDGDLWLVPDGMVWTDNETFEWPDDER